MFTKENRVFYRLDALLLVTKERSSEGQFEKLRYDSNLEILVKMYIWKPQCSSFLPACVDILCNIFLRHIDRE